MEVRSGDIVNILMIEADKPVLQEVVTFLPEKAQCQIMDLCLSAENRNMLIFLGLTILLKEQAVYRDSLLISLSYYEFFTLVYLAQHPGWVFTKKQIYEAVWHESGDRCGAAVTNVISQIRRKIGEGYIRTVVGSGYKFEVEASVTF